MADAWRLIEEQGIVRIEFDQPGTEVNVLTSQIMRELKDLLGSLAVRPGLKAVLFTSAKSRIFIAGADIKEIEGIAAKEDAFLKAEMGKEVFQLIEDLRVPTVAVINGACLGGGYELALACTYRVAAASEKVKIGLPEVNLGILPGFGGSIRMPKLLGLMRSIPLILAGRMVSAKEASKHGMVDRLFPEDSLTEKSLAWTKELIAGRGAPARIHPLMAAFEKWVLGPAVIYPSARRNVLRKTKGHYPAPLKTLELIQKTYGGHAKQSFRAESEAFSELAVTDVSKNLIKVFFLNERYKKRAWTTVKEPLPSAKQCSVIGAGVMGGGIAQLISYRDLPVKVRDINEKALQGAIQEAKRIYDGAVERKKLSEADRDRKLQLVSISASEDEVAQSDLIIEAVIEDLEIKKRIFKEWSAKAKSGAVFASNTSSLSVSEMAAAAAKPEQVAGLHFFNPVNRMPLVEIIRARQSSETTIERLVQFSRFLGKTVIVVQDAPGFLVNRLLLPYMNEAAYLLEEGMAPEVIDKIARNFGMPMGPVELVDQVGVDVGYKVAHILEQAFGERMKVAAILETVKSKGFLGKKTGKGFYVYGEKQKRANPEIGLAAVQSRPVDQEAVIERLIYVMINEAARCLDEKVVDEPATVDLGMIMGTGFPPFRGGLLRYADSLGTAKIVSSLKRIGLETKSARFEPSPYLVRLADKNEEFYKK